MELEVHLDTHNTRLELLEQALFKKNKQLSRTIFDDYTDKMSEMNVYLLTETQRLQDFVEANNVATEEKMFSQDQKVQSVLQLHEEVKITQ